MKSVSLMKDVEKVADDIYLIKQPMRVGWFCGVTLVLGARRIGLVDTGFEETPDKYIFPFLQELHRRPEEISLVVNTHRDGDHVWGNNAVKERTGATIAIHELEAEAVDTADLTLTDGDVVVLGDRDFTVVHTPGHRPGCICLYDPQARLLITGDTVCGDRRDLIRMKKELYIASLKTLLELPIHVMIMAHPFQPLGKSVLTGNEPHEMIQASIALAEKTK